MNPTDAHPGASTPSVHAGNDLRHELEHLGADFSPAARAMYAYDASNYRVVPTAVAFPTSAEHVAQIVGACHRHGVPVTARGAGTSMAGNAIGEGVVLDFSRVMNRVLAVDAGSRTAIVEPGLVLDDLQRALKPHDLMFAPDPSSHSRATIGGLVGNDACGNHSVKYGRTADHVIALDLVLADGSRVIAEEGGFRSHPAGNNQSADQAARLNAVLRSVTANHLSDFRLELGRIPRQVSGYQLHHLLPENGFDVAKALVGSEGTLALVVGATLALVPPPAARLLVALGYNDVIDAAADVPAILDAAPAALEGMDESIVAAMRERRGPDSVAGLPRGRAWLFVELEGSNADALHTDAGALIARVAAIGRMLDGRPIPDPLDRASLWRVRENGAGLATRRSDGTQTWAGWEDSAVAPDQLAAYLAGLRQLMRAHGVTGAFYGHFGAGCVHVRMDFDLHTDQGTQKMRAFVTAAAELVSRHGGSLSGEHGDGRARSDLLHILHSPRLLDTFARVKATFDPDNMFNPGVITNPAPLDADLLASAPDRVDTTRLQFLYPHDPGGFADAVGRCVGVGRCRSDHGGSMCPSYKVSHHESHSTRGRARALQEMLRGVGALGNGWRSKDVLKTLDLCLSCKACASECPVGVDMATYKAEFLHHHYRGRIRPRSHYALGWLPIASRIAGQAPSLVNAVMRIGPFRRTLAFLGGVTSARPVPLFHRRSAAWADVPEQGIADAAFEAVLFTDTFTAAFRPHLVGAAVRALNNSGVTIRPLAGRCCGLTWISTGQLGRAKKVLRRTVVALDDGTTAPIVILEPSCASALAKDAPELLGSDSARRVADRVVTFSQMVDRRLNEGWTPPAITTPAALQVHCHESATDGDATQRRVLRRMGVPELVAAEGCCGLAGNFGFERDHYETSIAVAGLSLVPTLHTPAAKSMVLADGFSCQTQIRHVAPKSASEPVHLAELLAEAIKATTPDP
ncbi:FAD-binding and (Fe-S)-binding domain-containing protein [Micromonosporaceae bacterium B7E4]